jgi:hypothetical protein
LDYGIKELILVLIGIMYDNKRDPINQVDLIIFTNSNDVEASGDALDFLSQMDLNKEILVQRLMLLVVHTSSWLSLKTHL